MQKLKLNLNKVTEYKRLCDPNPCGVRNQLIDLIRDWNSKITQGNRFSDLSVYISTNEAEWCMP